MRESEVRTNTSSEDMVFVTAVFEFEEMLKWLVVAGVMDYKLPHS